ncbi:MAG: hypothetical protein IPG34_19690 [Rhodocyclaceae bacterium]|nr:hypothetical protein [Rhodocyclaceae bacterium]
MATRPIEGFLVVAVRALMGAIIETVKGEEVTIRIGKNELYAGARDADKEWIVNDEGSRGNRPI